MSFDNLCRQRHVNRGMIMERRKTGIASYSSDSTPFDRRLRCARRFDPAHVQRNLAHVTRLNTADGFRGYGFKGFSQSCRIELPGERPLFDLAVKIGGRQLS